MFWLFVSSVGFLSSLVLGSQSHAQHGPVALPLLQGSGLTSIQTSCFEMARRISFPSVKEGERSRLFVHCESRVSLANPGQVRPIYSEESHRVLAEDFSVLTDCFDLTPQILFTKFSAESGFHTQILNPQGLDAGVGQLTTAAIRDVDSRLHQVRSFIESTDKSSCRALKQKISTLPDFWKTTAPENRCEFLAEEINPLKNLLYAAAFYRINSQYVRNEYRRLQISDLLQKAGAQNPDEEGILRILTLLGYNTGGATAVRNFRDFLNSRIDFQERKQREFSGRPLWSYLFTESYRKTMAFFDPQDMDFTRGLGRVESWRQAARQEILKRESHLASNDKRGELESRIGEALRNISVSQMTFPEWLKVWQSHGGPGYVSSLAQFARRFERSLGVGTCSRVSDFRID